MSEAEERLSDDPTSELWGEHRARYRFAAQFVAKKRVLDVACGSGFGLRMLVDAGASAVIGVDYDASTLASIRRADSSRTLVHADATRLPLQSESVDVVVSFETIEHVRDACALVSEQRRVLKPGGHLVLSTPNLEFGPPALHSGNPFHIREFAADELRTLLLDYFDDVHLYGQRPCARYRYVPFLMVRPSFGPGAITWKLMLRLPYRVRDSLAHAISGGSFYPGETDYEFDAEATHGAHALLAVAR